MTEREARDRVKAALWDGATVSAALRSVAGDVDVPTLSAIYGDIAARMDSAWIHFQRDRAASEPKMWPAMKRFCHYMWYRMYGRKP